MKLVPVYAGFEKHPMKCNCVECQKQLNIYDLLADIEGKPFQDYYCITCTELLNLPVAPNPIKP